MISNCLKQYDFYKSLSRIKRKLFQYWGCVLYNKLRYPKLSKKIFCKKRIKVVFFVINTGMWKNDDLFRLLLKNNRFDPYIISFLYDDIHSLEYCIQVQENIQQYCLERGFPYINSYNVNTKEWFDIKKFNPDIVFYAQPYNEGKKEFLIESFWDDSLFAYIPYCIDMENVLATKNTLCENIAWKLFYPTKYHKELAISINSNKGKNIVVTGYPTADNLLSKNSTAVNFWKNSDKDCLRIIWAPHHSILANDTLHYSNFLELADAMLDLANRYSDKVQFAFKPHPILKTKLYDLPEWGHQRTDEYYAKWNNGNNTILADGGYIDLFLTSDALIHDSSTFMAEYLYTHKPLMFIVKENYEMPLNEFGQGCLNCHYKGNSIKDIEEFINNVLIGGNDTMFEKRMSFYIENLLPPNGKSVAENIYQIMCEALDK